MITKYLIDDIHVPENHIQHLLSTDIKECTAPGNEPVSPCYDFAVELTDEEFLSPPVPTLSTQFFVYLRIPTYNMATISSFTSPDMAATNNYAGYFGDKDGTAATLGNVAP